MNYVFGFQFQIHLSPCVILGKSLNPFECSHPPSPPHKHRAWNTGSGRGRSGCGVGGGPNPSVTLLLDNRVFPLVPCVDSGDPSWSCWILQAQVLVFHPPSLSWVGDEEAWVPLPHLCSTPLVRDKLQPEGGVGATCPQHFPPALPPGTQPLRATEPSVPLRDVSRQSCGHRVLGGGTRVPQVEQSGGAKLEQAGEVEGTNTLPSKFRGALWDSDEPHVLAQSGHWAWLPLPYFMTSGQPCQSLGLSDPIRAMGRH